MDALELKNLLIAVLVFLLMFLFMGLVTYVDTAGEGSMRLWPQVVANAPAEPYACVAAQRGRMIYVDDSNSTTESFVCFCGVDADDATYIWLKVQDPATNCF